MKGDIGRLSRQPPVLSLRVHLQAAQRVGQFVQLELHASAKFMKISEGMRRGALSSPSLNTFPPSPAEIGDFDETQSWQHLLHNKYLPDQDAIRDKIMECHRKHT